MKPNRPICILLAVLTAFLALPVSADEQAGAADDDDYPYVTVIPDFNVNYTSGRCDVVDDVNSDSTRWTAQTPASTTVTPVSSLSAAPFESLDGGGCLNVSASGASDGQWKIISREFDEPLDLSMYTSLVYTVCCDRIGEGDYTAVLILRSETGSKRFESPVIEPETWNGIICDVSGWEGISSVDKIYIGVRYTTGETGSYNYNYSLDFVAVSALSDLERAIYFMTPYYSVSGAENSVNYYTEPCMMAVDITYSRAEQCSLYSGVLPYNILYSAEAIKIRLSNYSTCTKLTLEYATETQPSYKQNPQITVALEAGTDMQAVYFQIPEQDVTELKLSFDDDTDGLIEFYSISPASFYSPLEKSGGTAASAEGGITSCRLSSSNGGEITVKGTLTDNGFSAYRGMLLQIYELQPYMTNDAVFDEDTRPLKSISVSDSFTFELPLYDGERSRISSRFAVVVYDSSKNQTILLGSPFYITNPETIAENSWTYPTPQVKKGLICSASDALYAGVGYTIVDVDLGALFTSSADGIEHKYNGVTYYFDSGYTAGLDASITDLYIAGTVVNLRLLLTKPVYSEFVSALISSSSTSRLALYYGFSLDNAESAAYFEAACDFLARRYFTDSAEYGRATGLILGGRLDAAYRYYNLGSKTLRDYVDCYCRALRTAANVLRSVSSSARVYISTGNNWDGFCGDSASLSYFSRDIVDCIAEQIKREGNIAYCYCVDPYGSGESAVSDVNASASLYSNSFGIRSLPALCKYLKQTRFLYDSQARAIMLAKCPDMLYDLTSPVDADQAALEYILVYYAACSDFAPAVECYIADATYISGDMSGYLSTLRLIDVVNASLSATDYAKALYGVSEWSELVEGCRSTAPGERTLYEAETIAALPSDITGSAGLWSFGDGIPDFRASYSATLIENGIGYKGSDDISLAAFDSLTGGLYSLSQTFAYSRDLSCAPVISFSIYAEQSGDAPLSVSIIFRSPEKTAEFTVEIEPNRWNTVVCDLSDFTGVNSVEGMLIALSTTDGSDAGSVSLAVSSMTASSYKNSDDYIIKRFRAENESYLSSTRAEANSALVLALFIVIAAAASVEIIYVLARRRRIDIINKRYEESKKLRF